jgi:L-lactate utilization protein LutB
VVKKKAASQLEMITPEESQQIDRDIRAFTWYTTVGGKNRGHLYGATDMSSHFSHGASTTYYVTQLSACGRPTSSDIDLQRVIDDLQRRAEEREKAHQEDLHECFRLRNKSN